MTLALWVTAAMALSVIALPVAAAAVAATMAGLAGAALLAAQAALRPSTLVPRALPALGALLLLAGWMTLTSALAIEPRVSFFGLVGQHDGALLWVVCAVLAWSAAAMAGPRTLRLLVAAISVLGGVFAVGAVLDAAGVLDRLGRFSIEASGFLENSLSLGQLLVLSLGCSIAWAMTAREPGAKLVAGVLGAASLMGLMLAQSRAAWLALVAAVVIAAALHRASARTRRIALVTAVAITLATVALMPAALDGRLGEGPVRAVKALVADRANIWGTAYTIAGTDPYLGRGPDQFSCWGTWTVNDPAIVESTGVHDPHDVLLYLLVSAGVPGLLLGSAAFALFGDALIRSTAGRGGMAMTVLWAALLAWALSLRLAWVSPMPAFVASLLAGVILGTVTTGQALPGRWVRPPAWLAAAGCATLFVLLAGPAFTEIRWAVADHTRRAPAEVLEADYASWPDATYARVALEKRMAAGSDADLKKALELAAVAAPQMGYDVDLALTSARLHQHYGVRTGIETTKGFSAALDAGRSADPDSGLWDYIDALAASLRNDEPGFLRAASAALSHQLPPVAEERLRAELAARSKSKTP